MLLQIFTKPLGDRPTVFFEIIQRLCALPLPPEAAAAGAAEVSGRPCALPACVACVAKQQGGTGIVG